MLQFKHTKKDAKGWFAGSWNTTIPFAIGYANEGINESHHHDHMYEVYIVIEGKSTAIVSDRIINLTKGDILVVEPTEIHTFISSSPNYLHYVIQIPFIRGDKITDRAEN